MIVNEVVVIPSLDTLTYLQQVFSACPLEVDFNFFHVSLNLSVDTMEVDPDALYQATAGTMGTWYDSAIQASVLILPLVSPALEARNLELIKQAPNAFYSSYHPHMVMKHYMPPSARHYRAFLASVATTMATGDFILEFTGEMQTSRSMDVPPSLDYYNAQ